MTPTKSSIAVVMGIIIAIADIYWIYTSYTVALWLVLGVVILVADLIWLGIDFSFMGRPAKAPPPPPRST